MALWRRPKGRHAAGGARPVLPPVGAVQALPQVPAPLPMPHLPASPPPVSPLAAQPPLVPAAGPPAGPRVELTFRDGSSAALEGEQARALDEIARALTRRD